MAICPKCGGPLQETHTMDSDDRVTSIRVDCKKKFQNKKKKGCGYSQVKK